MAYIIYLIAITYHPVAESFTHKHILKPIKQVASCEMKTKKKTIIHAPSCEKKAHIFVSPNTKHHKKSGI